MAIPSRMLWSVSSDPLDDVPIPMVSFEWQATMHAMRSQAMAAYHEPLRFEVSPSLARLLDVRGEMLSRFDGVPVEVRDGPFLRLVTNRRTYEVNL